MSPARKRAAKGAKKTTKKAARKATAKKAPKARVRKKAPAKKAARKAASKTAKRDAKGTAAKRNARASSPQPSAAGSGAGSTAEPVKATRKESTTGVAQPLQSAAKKPGLGAKWACFRCGAKFYDLNKPVPICPKCQTDQRDQPAKSTPVIAPPAPRQPATPPISRLLDDEEASEAAFDEDRDAEAAAELDLGKLDEEDDYLDDGDFADDSDD